MISTLIYSSHSRSHVADTAFSLDLASVRADSAARNARDGITGFLFYFENRFVQIIEGDFEPVTSLFSCIRRDRRHHSCRIVWFSENESRAFDNWAMDCSMAYIEQNSQEVGVKLSFLSRFTSDTSQQHIKLRDLLIDIAAVMQGLEQFPRPSAPNQDSGEASKLTYLDRSARRRLPGRSS